MMMSEYSDIVKQGYLKTKGKNIGHWQKKWVILRRASSKGPNRLERFVDEKSSMLNYDCKTIELTDVERVERIRADNRMYIIVLWFSDGDTKKFAANSDMDVTDWHDNLLQHIGMRVSAVTEGAGLDTGNADLRDVFHVYLLPNTSTDYCGEYLLQVTSESIILREAVGNRVVLVTWRLHTLRRYGRDDSKFTFESGRLSQTGEGLFIYTTVECERIYQKVHSATQALVTVQNMARRQKDGLLLSEGVVLPVSKPLARHHSDTESLAHRSNGDISHDDLRDSKSLPPTPSRGPLPIPRKLGASIPPDSNANTKYLYTEANEDRRPLISQNSQLNYSSRPLPPAPSEIPVDAEELDYIYEEKGLSDNFRKFLRERKDDDLL